MIYQVFVGRHQGANLKDHPGQVIKRMSNWPWQNLKPLGITTIYLLGLFDYRGPVLVTEEGGVDLTGMPDRLPSPFALSDHERLHPGLGNLPEFTVLLNLLHSHNFKVIVDFVPNHTGTTHPWVTDHPEYYHQNQAGEFTREFSGDVIKLNYQNNQVVTEMNAVVETIAATGVDGVRCDMAHLVPNSFWSQAILKIKRKYPHFYFSAEAYSDSVFDWQPLNDLYDAGFDSLYHEALYRQFTLSPDEISLTKNLTGHLYFILNHYLHRDKQINYIQNHDDPFPEKFRHLEKTITTLVYLLPGTGLIYNGQLNRFFDRLSHHSLDLLPTEKNEVFNPPKDIGQLFELKQQLAAPPEKIEQVDDGTLRLSFTGGKILDLSFDLDPKKKALPLEIHSQSR